MEKPTRYIAPGEGQTRTTHGHIATILMDPFGPLREDVIWKGAEIGLRMETGIGIRLECPKGKAMRIRREIGFLARWLEGGFDPEEWVAGLTGQEARMTLHMSARAGRRQEMDLQAVIIKLRRLSNCRATWISLDSIFWDPSALIVDTTAPEVSALTWELCDDMATLSENQLIIRASAGKELWQDKMEELYRRDRKAMITRIRIRESVGGGIWAKPLATAEQISAIKKSEGAPGEVDEAKVTVAGKLSDSVGHLNAEMLQRVMGELKGTVGAVRKREADERPTAGTWLPGLSATFGDLDGSFSLVVRSEEEAAKVVETLKGASFRVCPKRVVVYASTDFQDAKVAKNCHGLRGSDPRRPLH